MSDRQSLEAQFPELGVACYDYIPWLIALSVTVLFAFGETFGVGFLSGGLLVVSFLTSVAIGMALELGQLLLNHVCCKCCPCHDDDAITDAPAGQRADAAQA